MYIVAAYPIATIPQIIETPLSYFIKEHIPLGSIVEITILKKRIPAIIASIEPLSEKKLLIKNQKFVLKKIQKIISTAPLFHPAIFEAAHALGAYYRENIGTIIKTLTPTALYTLPSFSYPAKTHGTNFTKIPQKIIIGSLDTRTQHYKTIARGLFAKNKSLSLITPTVALAEYYAQQFQDFPKHAVLLHGSLTPKKIQSAIEQLRNSSAASLSIGTPILLGALIGNETAIIVDDADSPHYIRHERPYIDYRKAIALYTESIQATYIAGKHMLSLQDIKDGNVPEYLSSRVRGIMQPTIYDTSKAPFSALSETLKHQISTINSQTIVFINRKGFYSFVMCLDCGRTVYCEKCKAPVTLHAHTETGYICHHCQTAYPADMICRHCSGWNLKGFGVGSERVYEDLQRAFPSRPIWRFDEDHAKTPTERASIIKAYMESENGILIGTELILETPGVTAAFVAVVTLDNLFSIPDYGIHERILSTLMKLEERSTDHPLFIQTRFPRHPVYQAFERRSIKEFLTQELLERKENNFPPFSIFIKIIIDHQKKSERDERVAKILAHLEQGGIAGISYPSFTKPSHQYILITVSEDRWRKNAEQLKHSLDTLPYPADIVVDPPSIL